MLMGYHQSLPFVYQLLESFLLSCFIKPHIIEMEIIQTHIITCTIARVKPYLSFIIHDDEIERIYTRHVHELLYIISINVGSLLRHIHIALVYVLPYHRKTVVPIRQFHILMNICIRHQSPELTIVIAHFQSKCVIVLRIKAPVNPSHSTILKAWISHIRGDIHWFIWRSQRETIIKNSIIQSCISFDNTFPRGLCQDSFCSSHRLIKRFLLWSTKLFVYFLCFSKKLAHFFTEHSISFFGRLLMCKAEIVYTYIISSSSFYQETDFQCTVYCGGRYTVFTR